MTGLLAAYEFAGYRDTIAEGLRAVADETATVTMTPLESDFRLASPGAPLQLTTSVEEGEAYTESTLIASFTGVVRCIDPLGDEESPPPIRPPASRHHGGRHDQRPAPTVWFHYGWASCLLIPYEEPPLRPTSSFAH